MPDVKGWANAEKQGGQRGPKTGAGRVFYCFCFGFSGLAWGWQLMDRKVLEGPLRASGVGGGEAWKVPASRLELEAESWTEGLGGSPQGLP